ncbi:hypothetical protein WSM22_27390 [Cytophagales bacterium WSM2-2]|nr:hypothetical protein WSM22_27390 [Cytophagales bacterium WSM2-2]
MKLNFVSTVRSRITIALFSLIAIIVISELIAYYRIKKLPNIFVINSIRQSLTKLQKDEVSLKGFATEFILRDKANVAFFKTGHSEFLARYEASLVQVNEDINTIEKQTREAGMFNDAEVGAFKKVVVKYDTIFRKMVEKIKERGSNKFGIIGEFDNAIMDLVRHDFGVDNVAILNLQLYVKEYLLSGNKGATNDVSNEIYNFSTVIEKYVKDSQVESVITSLSKYEDSFKKLVAVDEQLGTYTGEGLAKQLFSTTTMMDEAVQMSSVQALISHNFSSVSSQIYFSIILVTATAILIAIIISGWLNRTLVKPFRKIKTVIGDLGLGDIPPELSPIKLKELNEIVTALNSLIANIKDHHEFADHIGKGNFTAAIRSRSEKDVLGKALLNMRDSLRHFDQENKQRAWVAQGITQVEDIFRKAGADFKSGGSHAVISKLAQYVSAQLAGLYLINDDSADNYIELVASYGFEYEKQTEKRIEIGQGLLGQAIDSGESIYLSPVPKNYFGRITSGLGQSQPVVLLLEPLRHNDVTVGVIEIAGLHPFGDHQRLVVEKIAEVIASHVSFSKVTEQGKELKLDSNFLQTTEK